MRLAKPVAPMRRFEGIHKAWNCCSRPARSLQAAIASAIADVENAGYRVVRVEMEREAITASNPQAQSSQGDPSTNKGYRPAVR